MSSSFRIASLLTGALALGHGAGAQVPEPDAVRPAPDPVLDALVAEALQKNPDLLALQEAVVAARARPDQARSLRDPMLSVVYTNDGWAPSLGSQPMTTLGFVGSQDLPYPGKRGLRGELAARDADSVELQLERARLGVTAAVKRAYYGLVLSRERLALASDQELLLKQIEGTVRARYAVGQGAQPDVLRVQIEVTRVLELRSEQQAEASVRVAELNRLLDRSAASPLETKARLEARSAEDALEPLLERLLAASPERRSAELAQQRAGLEAALAQKEGKPDFQLQAGYMNRGGLDPMWLAGVGVTLPVNRKRIDGARAEAEAKQRASARQVDSVRLQLRYRTEERLAQLDATRKVAELYERGIIPQDRMAVDAALANYETGKVPFVAVLEALTTLYGDRAQHLGLLANHERIGASLEEASLEPTSSLVLATTAARPGEAGMGARSLP